MGVCPNILPFFNQSSNHIKYFYLMKPAVCWDQNHYERVIYVTVDPVTKEATFTSSDSRLNIRERDDVDCTPIGLPAEAGTPQCAEA